MGRYCRAARDRGGPRGAARLARAFDPVGAGSGPDAARPGPRFRRDDARATQGDDRQACGAKVLALDPQMGRRHDRRQGDQRADGDLEGNARPRPSVARAGQCVGREIDRRPRARPRDAGARRSVEAGNSRQSGVRRAGAGATGRTGNGAEGRSASPSPRRLSAGWRPRPARSADGSKRTLRAGRGSTGGSDSWRCARSCLAGPKSAAISPRWSTIGTPRRSSIALSCKSARTCNISASTARWSAGWSGS